MTKLLWPNGTDKPGDVWHEYGKRPPIQTPNGPTSSFHGGIDIGPDTGTVLKAPAVGEIIYAGFDSTFGNRVIVRVLTDIGTVDVWLCHGENGSYAVRHGDLVSAAQPLLTMGETGKAVGKHVHLETHVNGERVNPRGVFARANVITGKDEEMIVNIQGRGGVRRGGAFYIEGGVATFLGGNVSGAPSLDFDQGTALASRVKGIA